MAAAAKTLLVTIDSESTRLAEGEILIVGRTANRLTYRKARTACGVPWAEAAVVNALRFTNVCLARTLSFGAAYATVIPFAPTPSVEAPNS